MRWNSPHEPLARDDTPRRLTDRSFGFLLTGALLVATFFPVVFGHDVRWWLLPPAAVLAVVASLVPRLLSAPHTVWLRVARLVNAVVAPVIVGVVFFGTITPIALVTRVFGRDVLRRRLDVEAATYWVERPPNTAADMRNQY